jgi:hydroxymethylpyrimidine/phosphomethylpyrimidine kinase
MGGRGVSGHLPVPGRLGLPVLSIAGSDPSGGAGVQADLKAIGACGGYGMSVITALTAQNTRGVQGVHVPPVDFLVQQLRSVLSDVPPAAIKIGMLGSAEVILAVAGELAALEAAGTRPPVVLDPVMVATSGDRLLTPEGEAAMSRLFAHVDIVTPNAPELGALLGDDAASCTADLVTQARRLAREHRVWVLAKGGHVPAAAPGADPATLPSALPREPRPGGERTASGAVTDVLVSPEGEVTSVSHPFLATRNTHGTGCTLSSALATFAARGLDWDAATRAATDYLAVALAGADRLAIGSGHGPVNHLGALWAGEVAPGLGAASAAWLALAPRAEATYSTSVVAQLASGRPDAGLMHRYLGQDLAYLVDYADRLDAAARLAGERGLAGDAAFWAASATACREEEPQLHVQLGAEVPAPDAVTSAYAGHLATAEADGYEALVAALLPCFVLYAEVGARLSRVLPSDANAEARAWVTSYADPGFAASAAEAMARVDAIAAGAGPATVALMEAGIAESLEREIAFFDR